MGRSSRPRPARLAEKLLRIRQLLSLSQSQMLRSLGDAGGRIHAPHISEYESGKREPPLQVLLAYARAAGVPVELLIDDDTELPPRLPAGRSVWVLQNGRLWQQKSVRRK
jgi:transcriptional regulator with XRE-family HTH domain